MNEEELIVAEIDRLAKGYDTWPDRKLKIHFAALKRIIQKRGHLAFGVWAGSANALQDYFNK